MHPATRLRRTYLVIDGIARAVAGMSGHVAAPGAATLSVRTPPSTWLVRRRLTLGTTEGQTVETDLKVTVEGDLSAFITMDFPGIGSVACLIESGLWISGRPEQADLDALVDSVSLRALHLSCCGFMSRLRAWLPALPPGNHQVTTVSQVFATVSRSACAEFIIELRRAA